MISLYKSPLRKLVRFFDSSRSRWKERCLTAKKCIKRLKNRVYFLETSKAALQDKVKELETECERLRRAQTEAEEQADSAKKNLSCSGRC